jgi:mannose-6-phosphate isomerase
VASAHPAIGAFLQQPDATHLSQLFASLLNMQGEESARCRCCATLDREQGEPWQTIRLIAEFYPDDSPSLRCC